MAQVVFLNNDVPSKMVEFALMTIKIRELIKDKVVFLKVNLAGGPSDKKGAIISEPVTRAVIKYIKHYCKKLIIGEGGRPSLKETQTLFDKLWISSLCEDMNVELVNLWDTEFITVRTPVPMSRKEWKIPKIVLDSEIVGSLAVLKVSAVADVSLSVKNFFGILPIKNKFLLHKKIHETIIDLFQIIKPSFGIIDSLYGWEGGESVLGGNPVKLNSIIASTDLIALDTVAATFMGFNPTNIKYLSYAKKLKLGETNLNLIEVVGCNFKKELRTLRKPPFVHKIISLVPSYIAGFDSR